jgi:hypothetical protein
MPSFDEIFRTNTPTRDKFLSRVFGIFSEEIVRCWCKDNHAPYKDLGRPTLTSVSTGRRHTLDFTFQSRDTGLVYVGEMKCELEYTGYSYLTLTSPKQLEHHIGQAENAFSKFLAAAASPATCQVKVGGKLQPIDGAILVWGQHTPEGQVSVIEAHKLHTVLSVENLVRDLLLWQNQDFAKLLAEKEGWCHHLFTGLRGLNML